MQFEADVKISAGSSDLTEFPLIGQLSKPWGFGSCLLLLMI
jgi:hypothetical protein